jgi:hypothetical protein
LRQREERGSESQWSLRATIDQSFKDDLETLSMLLSHKRL